MATGTREKNRAIIPRNSVVHKKNRPAAFAGHMLLMKKPRGYPAWHCLQRYPRGSEEQELSEVVSRADHAAVFGFFIGHRAVLDCAGKLFGARTGECADAAASRRRYRGRHRCRDNAVRRSHHHQFRQQDS